MGEIIFKEKFRACTKRLRFFREMIFKKKLAHAYLVRRIFLSLLAGKLRQFEQSAVYASFCACTKRLSFLVRRIFLSLLAGKLRQFEQSAVYANFCACTKRLSFLAR